MTKAVMGQDDTTIQIKKKTRDRLDNIGHKRESYDEIVNRLLNGCDEMLKLRTRNEKVEDVVRKAVIAYKKVYHIEDDE